MAIDNSAYNSVRQHYWVTLSNKKYLHVLSSDISYFLDVSICVWVNWICEFLNVSLDLILCVLSYSIIILIFSSVICLLSKLLKCISFIITILSKQQKLCMILFSIQFDFLCVLLIQMIQKISKSHKIAILWSRSLPFSTNSKIYEGLVFT